MSELVLPQGACLTCELEIKRSRFLAEVSRIDSPEQARERIGARRSQFPDARHHCTGFVSSIRGSSPVLHSSDDGEPSGTAGRPILDTLVGIGLTDAVAVVSRYFGGTLLGTGGLVRAYSGAVRDTLEGAELLTRELVPVWSAVLPHKDAGRYISELGNAGFDGTPEYLPEGVRLNVPTAHGQKLTTLLAQLSGGTIQPGTSGEAAHERPWGGILNGIAVKNPKL